MKVRMSLEYNGRGVIYPIPDVWLCVGIGYSGGGSHVNGEWWWLVVEGSGSD